MIPLSLFATAEPSTPAEPSNVGLGSVVLILAVAVLLGGLAFLVITSRRRRRPPETPPPNLTPYDDDEALETTRLTHVLSAAAVAAAVLAILLPVYFVGESHRQAEAAQQIEDQYLEEGLHWWQLFECTVCHGADGGGGGAAFVEARSGLDTSWAVPSINDVFFRYTEDEVRHWITYGRQGTPMPAAGLDGGGSMTGQQIDQVVAYLKSIQVPQSDALAKIEGAVTLALQRIENAEQTIDKQLVEETAARDDILDAPAKYATIEHMPDDIDALLSGDGTCTDSSAALVGTTCAAPGSDRDRDGLSDVAEETLTTYAATAYETLTARSVQDIVEDDGSHTFQVTPTGNDLYLLELSPDNAFTMSDERGRPVADLDSAEHFMQELRTAHLQLEVVAERQDRFLGSANEGIAFLEKALEDRAWDVDFEEVATRTGLDLAGATRAVGLFNAYCARCHTAGYSAGVAFEQAAGSGAWAPALRDGRAVTQFPSFDDHVAFVIRGAQADSHYGVNGLSGVGGMPAFGEILSQDDIELIVTYERSL